MTKLYPVLKAEYGQCPEGCSLCVQACNVAMGDHHGPRIKVLDIAQKCFHGVLKCNQCSEPACMEICPVGAIVKSEIDGVVRISEAHCIGCGLCTLSCPYGGVYFDSIAKKAFKCENCDGNPKCVVECPYGVLSYLESFSTRKYLGPDLMTPGAGTCIGCNLELTVRFILRVLGDNIIVFRSAGCGAVAMGTMPQGAAIKTASCVSLMTDVPAVATGAKRYLKKIGRDITCVVIGGDGLTADVGFQSLSGAAERGENLLYICIDNEAYMNTGIQRSSTTPYGSWTTTTPAGKDKKGKDMPLLMVFHHIPYVATATMAYSEDFALKLLKAKAIKDGMAYLHILSPCVVGWRTKDDRSIEIARMAVNTNYFPLWEFENGKLSFTYRVKNARPLRDFVKLMDRFNNLKGSRLLELEKDIKTRMATLEILAGREL